MHNVYMVELSILTKMYFNYTRGDNKNEEIIDNNW